VNRIPGRHFLRNLVERRTLLTQLVRRDFKQRYIGSAAGWLWGVVHPLVLLASWIFVFQICMKVKLPGVQNYSVYLFAGMLPWLLFQDTVLRSSVSLLDHSNLITKTVFPAEVVPVSIFLSSLIHHLIALVVAVVWAAFALKFVSPMLLLLPVYMVFVGLLGVGVGWIAASLHVYLRDTAQVLTVIMTLWFWATPIMIAESQIPERWHHIPLRPLIQWNPLSSVVRGYRERMLTSSWPPAHDMITLAAMSITVFVLGGLFFRHLKRGFADVL
jgi:lipopolysaccharide transport system permease protein